MNPFTKLIDLLYPPRCHICESFFQNEKNTGQICQTCLNGFSEINPPLCPVCRKPFDSISQENHLCESCLRKRPYYDALGAPYIYEGGIMEGIHLLKYSGRTQLADSLGILLGSFAKSWLQEAENSIIIPIPLYPKRLRQRKFNQSLLLARSVNSFLNMDLDYMSLRRTRQTQPQTGLKKDERRKNVKKAFDLIGKPDIAEKTVILIDDVATTGSTLNECAGVLKKAGAEKVFCLVIARAVKG